MTLWALVVLALGVSADAFAVSLGKGLAMRRFSWQGGIAIAGAFGAAQAAMLVAGWALAVSFADAITAVDHWIAFTLLAAIGTTMLWGALRGGADEPAGHGRVGARELAVLAVATSIDALAVGVALAFLDTQIAAAAALVGITTLGLSLLGVRLGHHAGARLGTVAEVAGGAVLVLIGTRILLDHLGLW